MSNRIIYHAFTSRYDGISNVLINDVTLVSGSQAKICKALWDTGATGSCISDEVARDLGLTPIGMQTIKTPSGEKDVETYLIDIILPNEVTIKDVVVCGTDIGSQGIQMLIGMDVIGIGDFAVSNYDGKTVFSYRIPSKYETDYVKQIRIDNTIGPKHGKGKRKKK